MNNTNTLANALSDEEIRIVMERYMSVVAEYDSAILQRMIDVLMAEFPGKEGFDTVLGQLPHLLMAMLMHDVSEANDA